MVTENAIETHVRRSADAGLPAARYDHRLVLAMLAYLRYQRGAEYRQP